jgi:ribonucleotide monophosphatase NagD (HAD superfamily)
MALISKSKRKADPLKTKNGKQRIFVLSENQLKESLEKSGSKKTKDKIQRRLFKIAKLKRGV